MDMPEGSTAVFTVSPGLAGQRLDAALKETVPSISRTALQKAIKNGCCLIDGQVVRNPASKLQQNQTISLQLPDSASSVKPAPGNLQVVWQDKDIAVCVKPAGLTVHPCPSCDETTFVDMLAFHFPEILEMGGQRPGIVHRLDKDTSGLIVVALNEHARLRLAEEFAQRKVVKEYLAIATGTPQASGQCDLALGRDPVSKIKVAAVPESKGGKTARTSWKLLWSSPEREYSLLKVAIHTGRTHQIRVHLAKLGYPLLGDSLYAPPEVAALAPRQMLHAWRLSFRHPITAQDLDFVLDPPPDFIHTLLKRGLPMQKLVITGNPGCGKSAFCSLLERSSLPGVSADQIVKSLYATGGEAAAWLYTRGAPQFLAPDGSVSKTEILKLLESGGELKSEFESFVHALVRKRIEDFFACCAADGHAAAWAEIPLYFECGWQKKLPALTIGIECADEERHRRLAHDRGWSDKKIESIEKWQLPQAEKLRLCDIVCPNDGSIEDLKAQCTRILSSLAAERAKAEAQLADKLAEYWKIPPPRDNA